MASMILATNPERQILEASPELASAVGSAARLMARADCANIVRCRNADGKPLCHDFCPALMALRSRSRVAEGLRVWLEHPSGRLEPFDATFQRIDSVPSGMVVGFFGRATGAGSQSAPLAAAEALREPRPTTPAREVPGNGSRPSKASVAPAPRPVRRRGRLHLISG